MIASRIAATAAAVVLTLAPLAVAIPAQADSGNPQGANVGRLYYDGSVVRTVATPTSHLRPTRARIPGAVLRHAGGDRPRRSPLRGVAPTRTSMGHLVP